MATKLDIFPILAEFDRGSMDVREQLKGDPEVLKEFDALLPFMLVMWMTGATDNRTHAELIARFNRKANPYWGTIRKDPDLMSKFLAMIGPGRPIRHHFVRPGTQKKIDLVHDLLRLEYPDVSESEVRTWCRLNSVDVLIHIAKSHGYQDDDIEAVVKAYGGR